MACRSGDQGAGKDRNQESEGKYNKVFGYYLEVTNSYKDLVPDYFIRKQTLANAERYFTPELKELEDTILGAEDKLTTLEYEYFREIREHIASQIERIRRPPKRWRIWMSSLPGLRGGDKPLLQAQDEQKGHHRYQERTASGGGEDDPQRYVH